MRKFYDTVINAASGRPLEAADIRVLTSAGALATLYSDDGGTSLDNPVSTNELGYFEFYVANGTYTLQYEYGGAILKTITDVDISEDVTELALGAEDGASLVGFVPDADTAEARTALEKLREWRTFEDFGAVGYGTVGAATAGTNSTTAVQAAIDWCYNSGGTRGIRFTDNYFLVDNIDIKHYTTIIGAGRQCCGFVASDAATGAWISAVTKAQKVVLTNFAAYGRDQIDISHVMKLDGTDPDNGQAGTEGYIEGLWLRDAPEGHGLYIDGNVYYAMNITVESVKYGFTGIGTGNYLDGLTAMQCGADAGTASTSYAISVAGWKVQNVHVEAPVSTSVPIQFSSGDSFIDNWTISCPPASSFPALISAENLNNQSWGFSNGHVYNQGNITVTGGGLVRYGDPSIPTWTYVLGTTVSDLSGLDYGRSIEAREKLSAANGRLELKGQRKQAFMIRVTNTGGTIQHRIGCHGDSSAAGSFHSKVTGASQTLANTPTGADASTAFTNGAKISGTSPSILVLDTPAQTIADQIAVCRITFNSTATALNAWAKFTSRDVSGTTRIRLEIQLTNASSGAAFSYSSIGVGQIVDIQVEGYLA